MSNETIEKEDQELEELRKQIEQKAEAEKEQASKPVEPEPTPPEPATSQASDASASDPAPVTPNPSQPEQSQTATGKDDPMEWAKKKGFKTPEDMARALLQKEQEFHQSRQQKANGQQSPQVPPQDWQPAPQMGYGYPPPPAYVPQPRVNPRELAPYYPQLAPEDVERVMPLVLDAAEVISNRKMAALRQEFGGQVSEIQRTTMRNNELMQLMQDPAFRDNRVQKEVHSVLDSDPSIFQRERTPYAYAYEKALANMTRKQLQQGFDAGNDTLGKKPPVTAGGGNGSANTAPAKITEKMFDSWTPEEQKSFLNSNGRIIPKR